MQATQKGKQLPAFKKLQRSLSLMYTGSQKNPERRSNLYNKFTICVSNKVMGKIRCIQTILTRDMNGYCKLWSPKLSCVWLVFFYKKWRYQVKVYQIQSICDYLQNTRNYTYNQASFKGASVSVAYQSREKEDQGRKYRTETFSPFSQVNNAKDS